MSAYLINKESLGLLAGIVDQEYELYPIDPSLRMLTQDELSTLQEKAKAAGTPFDAVVDETAFEDIYNLGITLVEEKPIAVNLMSLYVGRFDTQIKTITQELLNEVLKENGFETVQIHNGNTTNANIPAIGDKTFYIELNSSVTRSATEYIVPTSILDVERPRGVGIGVRFNPNPTRDSYPIYVEGYEVASIGPNYMFLSFDLLYNLGGCETEIVDKELELWTKLLEFISKYLNGELVRDPSQAKEAYMRLCRGRLEIRLNRAKETLILAQERVADAKARMIRNICKIEDAKATIAGHESRMCEVDELYEAEWSKLLDINHVIDIRICGTKLVAYTDTIYATDDRSGLEHVIGEMKIEIDPDSQIRFFNQTMVRTGYEVNMNAPHVYHHGGACLGNIETALTEAIGNHEYSVALQLAVAFLEEVNTDDIAGTSIVSWPLREPKKCPKCESTFEFIQPYNEHVQNCVL